MSDSSRSKNRQEFRHESLQDRRSIVKYLDAISNGISSGKLELSDGDHQISLEPGEMVEFELRSSLRRGHRELTLKLSWRDQPADRDPSLTIRADEDTGHAPPGGN